MSAQGMGWRIWRAPYRMGSGRSVRMDLERAGPADGEEGRTRGSCARLLEGCDVACLDLPQPPVPSNEPWRRVPLSLERTLVALRMAGTLTTQQVRGVCGWWSRCATWSCSSELACQLPLVVDLPRVVSARFVHAKRIEVASASAGGAAIVRAGMSVREATYCAG